MEPFYHPKHLPAAATPSPSQLSTTPSGDAAQSLPNNLREISTNESTEKKTVEKQSEEPRTPHSRAKNLTRFYPVTKDTPVIKPDVKTFRHRMKNRLRSFFSIVSF